MSETQVNETIDDIYEKVTNKLPMLNGRVRRAAERGRLVIADILAKHTSTDGTIPRNQLNAVLTELMTIEPIIYRQLRTELNAIVGEVSADTTEELSNAIYAIFGIAALAGFAGVSAVAIEQLGEGAAEALFNALTGFTYKGYQDSVVRSTFNRIGESDDLTLTNRLRNAATTIRREVSNTLRESIRTGEGTSEMIRKVDRDFKSLEWRLDSLTETETLYAMRQTIAKFAEDSEMVTALRIIDYPHGDPAEHRRHRCYIYSHSDEHGLGEGVYPVGTRKIRNPHPRCRSTLHFVMVDALK
jgi:hypothetical protein